MDNSKANIITQLRRGILSLDGYKPMTGNISFDGGLRLIKYAFPKACFPLGAIHKFFCNGSEDISAFAGFIAGIVLAIMQKGGVAIWINSSQMIFPPALKAFGIEPDKIIFGYCTKRKRNFMDYGRNIEM